MDEKISDIRKDYRQQTLLESTIASTPLMQFEKWWQEAMAAQISETNAMTLATSSIDGMPSARVVLLKGFSEKGFLFFTNYNSFKGQQIAENPKACLVFFWRELERQVRVTGLIEKADIADSEAYFHSRPKGSQIAAIASPQSEVIQSREWLDQRFNTILAETQDKPMQRPPHWGGYIVRPIIVEFWQGRPSRLHDRVQYSLEGDNWKIERLAP